MPQSRLEGAAVMKRGLAAALFSAVAAALLLSGGWASAAPAGDAQVRAFAADFDDFLSFAGGVPLSADERREVAEQTAADFRSDPGVVRTVDADVRKVLANLHDGDEATVAERRETLRLQLAALPEPNLGRRIVERNDPTVVFDRAHHRLVTAASFAALRRGCTWMAGILGVPGPDAVAMARERMDVQANYGRFSDAQQDALAHLGRTVPLAQAAFDKADASKRAQFVAALRPYAREGKQLVPLTATVLAQANGAIETQRVNDSIVLMSTFNYNMLYHRSYYH
jgi:hypothetical protein